MSYSLSEAATARRPWWKRVAALVGPARLPKSCATAPAAPPRWPQFRRASPFLRIGRIKTKVCPEIARPHQRYLIPIAALQARWRFPQGGSRRVSPDSHRERGAERRSAVNNDSQRNFTILIACSVFAGMLVGPALGNHHVRLPMKHKQLSTQKSSRASRIWLLKFRLAMI